MHNAIAPDTFPGFPARNGGALTRNFLFSSQWLFRKRDTLGRPDYGTGPFRNVKTLFNFKYTTRVSIAARKFEKKSRLIRRPGGTG